jgi:predicted transcriptional regulator
MSDTLTAFLDDAANREPTNLVTLTVRELLAHWGAQRRGYWIVGQIKDDLAKTGLTTAPDFAGGWIDKWVTLLPIKKDAAAESGDESIEAPDTAELTDSALSDVALRVEDLPSANTKVISVAPDQSLEMVQSLMMRYDFSQLAVMSGQRSLRGAVSWESIAQARIRNSEATLRDAITKVEIVSNRDHLLPLVPRIMSAGFVFVLAKDQTVQGIVTTADLSQKFADLANPYFVLSEIERRLRRSIDTWFTRDQIAAAKDPRDTRREVKSADNLTLGESNRLLSEPDNWKQLGWRLDRRVFIEALEEVLAVRNEVMHFSPDPLEPKQLAGLDNFVRWLRKLEPDA